MAGGFANLYTSGDVVLRNPKESAVIFVFVVLLSVLLEKVFHFFRHHKSKYVRLMFGQISEELQCVGFIALGIMFFAASIVSVLPSNWFLLFEWTHMVLFFMMMFFVINVCITVVYIRNVLKQWTRFEEELKPGENEPQKSVGTRVKTFFQARELFKKQLQVMYGNSVMSSVPFSNYLKITTRGMIVKFTDITWMCWGSLTFAAIANSVREYVIPGKLQSKDLNEFTLEDRLWNQISFIVVMGYGPLTILLFAVFRLQHNFTEYLNAASKSAAGPTAAEMQGVQNPQAAGGAGGASPGGEEGEHKHGKRQTAKLHVNGRTVFISADAFTEALLQGEALEDPSRYLIRGSLTFTLHMLKIPMLLLEFYLSMYMLGMLYESAVHMDVFRYILLPAAIIPIIICLMFLPWALLMITILCSIGSKMKERTLYQLLEAQHRKEQHGHEEEESEGEVEESSDEENEHHGGGGHENHNKEEQHGLDPLSPSPQHGHGHNKNHNDGGAGHGHGGDHEEAGGGGHGSPAHHGSPGAGGMRDMYQNVMMAAESEALRHQRVELIDKIKELQEGIYGLLNEGDFKHRDAMLKQLEEDVKDIRIDDPRYEEHSPTKAHRVGPIVKYDAISLKNHLKVLRTMTDVYL